MANIADSKTSFFRGLSDLWQRFFKDKNQLIAMYQGSEIVIGQVYLEMLSNVLNTSIRETRVFNKEFFKLLTIREDLLEYDITRDQYVFELPDNIKDFQYLYNKIFEPTTLFEKNASGAYGFEIDTSGEFDELRFTSNLFDWNDDGTNVIVPGVASRTVQVEDDDGNISDQREVSFWIPDAQLDQFNMYLNYGYLLNRFEPSSEGYRALLQGIMRYFVLGPTLSHITSALNTITGLPVVRNDGEVLQSVDTSDSEVNVVKTDQFSYEFAKEIPLREDIENTENWGTLTFDAFEQLTTVFTVKDAIKDPTWWFDTTIPQRLLPDEPRARRVISPKLVENKIGNPPGQVRIGDPGFIIGADEDGFVPADHGMSRPGYRHVFAYIIFERYLKHHVFGVVYDTGLLSSGTSIPFPRVTSDIQEIIVAGKPAYVFLQFEPSLVWEEQMQISDEFSITPKPTFEEQINAIDSTLQIGTRSWKIGDYYLLKYRTLRMQASGYTPAIDSDVGKEVVGGTTGDTGTLAHFNNTTRLWTIVPDEDTDEFDSAEAVTITGGTGAGTMTNPSSYGTEPFIGNKDDHGGGVHPIKSIGETMYCIGGADPKKLSQREYVEYSEVRSLGTVYSTGPAGTFYDEDVGRWLEFDDGGGDVYWTSIIEVISDTQVRLNTVIRAGTFTVKLWDYEGQSAQSGMGEALQIKVIPVGP